MSKKNHTPGPVPSENRSNAGTVFEEPDQDESGKTSGPKDATGTQQDTKHRLGDFTGTGEHSRQEPGPKNDGGKRHGEDAD
ncbi:hypothetical protein [Zavarzinella formosa]|uniref:hypothetical protein n=1 Tax=Zavarzinella formosa TaxID=360055 RepID=UPI00030285C7|nr:hypothetical protein [Zavarzinella formosa]